MTILEKMTTISNIIKKKNSKISLQLSNIYEKSNLQVLI